MYAFIEVDVEDTPDNIVEIHNELLEKVKPKAGIPDKEWRQALDRYLTKGDMDAEVYEAMSDKQKQVIQEIKKAFKRINK